MSFAFVSKLKFVGRYIALSKNPSELNNVIALNSATLELATDSQKQSVVDAFQATPLGRKAFKERPRVDHARFHSLGHLPPNTLGRTYFDFIVQRNLNPEDLPNYDPTNTGDEFTYARTHLFETHDLWHVLTGFDTDTHGELGLQAFYLTQFPAHFALILFSSGFLGQAQQPIENSRKTLESMVRGYSLGKQAHDLIGRDWNREWESDLTTLRKSLGIELQ